MNNVIRLKAFPRPTEEAKMFNRDSSEDDYGVHTGEDTNYHGKADMAEQLYWRPICDNNEPLDKQLKWILKEEGMTDNPLSTKDLGFLKGLKAAGVKDAQSLIEAVEKYGYIELFDH